MFFNAKREEAQAITQFRKVCTYHGLNVHVSLHALNALKEVITAEQKGEEADITERSLNVLTRRGFVRTLGDDSLVVTQLGLLIIALAEAGDLVTIRPTTVRAIKEKA